MELSNDQLKDLIQELHERISYLEAKSLNRVDNNLKPDSYEAKNLLDYPQEEDEWTARERACGAYD
jgi:hypothetical protein|tara:strand:+ start:119 stop:316 length:198 start_codon:yes stop_codon:yes gene_type:complete